MPWASEKARAAALLRIARASARTMADETAARWCGKKDWGEARPRPYGVESCPWTSCVDLASALRRRITAGERAPVDSEASRWTRLLLLLHRVAVVTWSGVDAAHACTTVERRVGGRAHRLAAVDNGPEVLQRVAENAKEWPSVVEAAPPQRSEPRPRAPRDRKGVKHFHSYGLCLGWV